MNTKDRKYGQLQSSVFGGGYHESEPVYDKEAKRNAFGSAADWKTEAGMAKPVNSGGSRVDTFGKRQQQLGSSVFEQTDYAGYAPITKKKIDMDNVGHKHKTQPKGRKADDVLKAGSKGFEPVRKDYSGYNAANAKRGNLSSAFDVDATVYGGGNNN